MDAQVHGQASCSNVLKSLMLKGAGRPLTFGQKQCCRCKKHSTLVHASARFIASMCVGTVACAPLVQGGHPCAGRTRVRPFSGAARHCVSRRCAGGAHEALCDARPLPKPTHAHSHTHTYTMHAGSPLHPGGGRCSEGPCGAAWPPELGSCGRAIKPP